MPQLLSIAAHGASVESLSSRVSGASGWHGPLQGWELEDLREIARRAGESASAVTRDDRWCEGDLQWCNATSLRMRRTVVLDITGRDSSLSESVTRLRQAIVAVRQAGVSSAPRVTLNRYAAR
jgi:hypothetical protein